MVPLPGATTSVGSILFISTLVSQPNDAGEETLPKTYSRRILLSENSQSLIHDRQSHRHSAEVKMHVVRDAAADVSLQCSPTLGGRGRRWESRQW